MFCPVGGIKISKCDDAIFASDGVPKTVILDVGDGHCGKGMADCFAKKIVFFFRDDLPRAEAFEPAIFFFVGGVPEQSVVV